MSNSIMDSPWMRLLEIDYASREDYQTLKPWEDSNQCMDKVEEEIDAEIQAERRASKRLSEKLIDKMKNGELGFAEKLAHDAGYDTSYAAMCSLSKERKDRLYYRILDLMENELWSYHLPREFRNLLRELHLENDADKDAVAKDLKAIEERIKNDALKHVIIIDKCELIDEIVGDIERDIDDWADWACVHVKNRKEVLLEKIKVVKELLEKQGYYKIKESRKEDNEC